MLFLCHKTAISLLAYIYIGQHGGLLQDYHTSPSIRWAQLFQDRTHLPRNPLTGIRQLVQQGQHSGIRDKLEKQLVKKPIQRPRPTLDFHHLDSPEYMASRHFVVAKPDLKTTVSIITALWKQFLRAVSPRQGLGLLLLL